MTLCFGGKDLEDKVNIREAQKDDFDWVSGSMQDALEPYHGGDHFAHAKRIFDAHIAGGDDHIGFFSFEQRMFILEIDGIIAGMIHLVGKKQSTYKISPLIISPKFQGRFGLGSQLLTYAEEYVRRNNNARQLYCTVAEKNYAAMQFFLRKGFIKAGSSDSHYKNDIIETMLYKPLFSECDLEALDGQHVSVLPLDETEHHLRSKIRQILLGELPKSFEGIDNSWVSSLFEGYDRRSTKDINAKYKLIYVALDSTMTPIGVACATPKKGSPIKVMPFIAKKKAAFEALLIDIPHQLSQYGHKLYIHIDPTAEEVISLQRMGWNLDAALPSGYKPDVVTQQWSIDINSHTMRTMRVKDKFFTSINSGAKTLEVRVGYKTINSIKISERIRLTTHTDELDVKVSAIRRYQSFEKMFEVEPYKNIMPWANSMEEVRSLLRQFYPENKEKSGVVVLEFSPING